MIYSKTPEYNRSTKEQKIIYLWLLDNNHAQFKRIKKGALIDSYYSTFANLQVLAENGLIFSHPTLRTIHVGPDTIKKAKGLSISIKDDSQRALAWAVLDFDKITDLPECETKCVELMKNFAAKNIDYLNLWDGLGHYFNLAA